MAAVARWLRIWCYNLARGGAALCFREHTLTFAAGTLLSIGHYLIFFLNHGLVVCLIYSCYFSNHFFGLISAWSEEIGEVQTHALEEPVKALVSSLWKIPSGFRYDFPGWFTWISRRLIYCGSCCRC